MWMKLEVRHLELEGVERVRREINADAVLFFFQRLGQRPRLAFGNDRLRDFRHSRSAEEGVGGRGCAGLKLLPVSHKPLQSCAWVYWRGEEILRAVKLFETIHCAGLHQAFQRFLVHRARVHATEKVEGILERPGFLALGDNVFYRSFAHAFDGVHAEADDALALLSIHVYGESFKTLVHIRP